MLTQKELAKLLKVDITTLWRWRKEGMPSYKVGKGVRYKEEEVMEWINKQTK